MDPQVDLFSSGQDSSFGVEVFLSGLPHIALSSLEPVLGPEDVNHSWLSPWVLYYFTESRHGKRLNPINTCTPPPKVKMWSNREKMSCQDTPLSLDPRTCLHMPTPDGLSVEVWFSGLGIAVGSKNK